MPSNKNSPELYNAAPNDVTAQIYADRWELLRAIETTKSDEEHLINLLIELCSEIARHTHNRVLIYKLHNIKHIDKPASKLADSDSESGSEDDSVTEDYEIIIDPKTRKAKRRALIRSILNSLSIDEYHLIFINYVEYKNKLSAIKGKKSIQHNFSDSEGKLAREILFKTLVMNLDEITHNISELADVSGDTVSNMNASMHTHHPTDHNPSSSTPNILSELMSPFFIVLGVFQVGYDVTSNTAALRNSYGEFQQAIKSLDKHTIKTIIEKYPGDPDSQINAIKQKARQYACESMYSKVLYTGSMYSIFFGMSLAFLIPLAYVFTIGGFFISMYVARKFRNAMQTRIDEFIHQPQLDLICIDIINATNRNIAEAKPKLRIYKESIVTKFTKIFAAILRFIVLCGGAIIGPFMPFMTGVVAAVGSMFNWKPISVYLKTIKDKPIVALQGILDFDEEAPSLVYYRGSNMIRTYIFKTKGIEALKRELIAADIQLKTESKIMQTLRKFLSPIGIMYSSETNAILEALYNGTNPAAVHLLEKIRFEAKHEYLENDIKTYLSKHASSLGLSHDLQQIRAKHIAGDSYDLNKLMRGYLEHTAVNNIRNAILISGFTIGTSWALLILGIGLTFFTPIAPFFALAATTIITVSASVTIITARREMREMRKKFQNIPNDQFEVMLQSANLTHFKNFMSVTKYDEEIENVQTLGSYSKLLRAYSAPISNPSDKNNNFINFCEKFKQDQIKAKLPNVEYVTSVNEDKSISLLEVKKGEVYQANATDILTAPADVPNQFNLHAGTDHSWQMLFAYMLENNAKECAFSLGNVNLHARAEQFIEALLLEFMSNGSFNCSISFKFEDLETAHAIFKVLEHDELKISHDSRISRLALDKLRTHFGLILLNKQLYPFPEQNSNTIYPYFYDKNSQNQDAFSVFVARIAHRENISLQMPEYFTNLFTTAIGPVDTISKDSVSMWQNAKQGLFDMWHEIRDAFVSAPEIITLQSQELECAPELKESILICFKARKSAIERNIALAKRNNNTEQLDFLNQAVFELESDFKEFVEASRDPDSPNKEVSTLAIQYCEKRNWLPSRFKISNDPNQFSLVKPTDEEADAITKLKNAAHILLRNLKD